MRLTDQWNNLPREVVVANTLNTFKNRLDKLWSRSDVYFNHEVNVLTTTSARGTRRAHLNATNDHIDLMSEA